MPDDISPLGERPYEPRLATGAGLEYIMGQTAKLPARLPRTPLIPSASVGPG